MSTPTPGPWRIIVETTSGSALVVISSNGERVADPGGSRSPKAEANARLIAAAPDLLAAAKGALDTMDAALRGIPGHMAAEIAATTDILESLDAECVHLRSVIAKAEGGAG